MIRIGDWQVDADGNRLIRGRECIRIEPKAMAVLCALHARRGGVLSKDELIRSVWGDVAVSDEVLTTAVYQLRRALGDDHRSPRYIETVPRRGYRLIAHQRLQPIRWEIAAAGLAIVVALVIGVFYGERRAARELHQLGIASLEEAEASEAIRLLGRATELDPHNASTAGALALAIALSDEPSDRARSAAARALSLDEMNPHALTARAIVALWSDWEWHAALRDLRAAARSGDRVARAWLEYASVLAGQPIMVGAASPDRRPLVAITDSTKWLLVGEFDAARQALAAALRHHPNNDRLLKQAAKIEQRRRGLDSRPLDDRAALAALESAFAARDQRLLYLRVDSRWSSIRQHPRFREIAAVVGP